LIATEDHRDGKAPQRSSWPLKVIAVKDNPDGNRTSWSRITTKIDEVAQITPEIS
jgi:hypothetical protein